MKKRILNRKHLLLILATVLIVFGTQEGYGQTLTASTPHPLTEATLRESVVTLTLNGGTYERFRWDIADALTVFGIPGVTIGTSRTAWFGVGRVSDTKITVELGFDGNMDADATLTFTVGADAIANYNGPALTAEVPVITQAANNANNNEAEMPDTSKQGPPDASEEDSGQNYIEGPWLWMIVPTGPAEDRGVSTEIDSLANASSGAITEAYVAQNGVSEGDPIEQLRWTSGKIHWSEHQCQKYNVERKPNAFLAILTLGLLDDECIDPTVCWADNISNVASTLGMGTELRSGARTAYALINLISPSEQRDVILTAKSGDAIKIWLNGNVVHRDAAESYGRRKIDVLLACDPTVDISDPALQESDESSIPVTLKAGNNLLLVKVRQHGEYWGMRVRLDGDFTVTIPQAETTPGAVAEDVNGDGTVDVQDLVAVAQQYGQTGTNSADVNDDGIVDIDDLILVAAAIDADAAAAPSLYSDALETLTVADVKLWLSQARQRDVTDPSVRKGILFLEQLLASMVPKEPMLLANYPNPFNPETWIPYQLAEPGDVRLTIYDIQGRVVRVLDLGHQRAGQYQSRTRAAYWDGRNALGEPVASGLYFYTLTAGDFSATRKMLITK